MEIWKDIKGYEGLYQVSNYGNIKNYKTNKNLAFNVMHDKRLVVHLWKTNTCKKFVFEYL